MKKKLAPVLIHIKTRDQLDCRQRPDLRAPPGPRGGGRACSAPSVCFAARRGARWVVPPGLACYPVPQSHQLAAEPGGHLSCPTWTWSSGPPDARRERLARLGQVVGVPAARLGLLLLVHWQHAHSLLKPGADKHELTIVSVYCSRCPLWERCMLTSVFFLRRYRRGRLLTSAYKRFLAVASTFW